MLNSRDMLKLGAATTLVACLSFGDLREAKALYDVNPDNSRQARKHRQRLRMSGHSRSSPAAQLLTHSRHFPPLPISPPDADQCRSEAIP